jgi:hypothetical protein
MEVKAILKEKRQANKWPVMFIDLRVAVFISKSCKPKKAFLK